MWSKSNADKLKMELSGKREKQLQSIKSEKVAEDNSNMQMDSGFLSGANLSSDIMLSKENFEDNMKHEELLNDEQQKGTKKITLDSGEDICDMTGDLGDLNIDQKSCDKSLWTFNFQQNDDGDTPLHLAISHGYIQLSKRLIDICPDSKILDIRNDDGQNALHSKENIEDDIKHKELLNDKQQKETTKITLDSGVDIWVTDDLGDLNIDREPYHENVWRFYFQQNDDGDTYLT